MVEERTFERPDGQWLAYLREVLADLPLVQQRVGSRAETSRSLSLEHALRLADAWAQAEFEDWQTEYASGEAHYLCGAIVAKDDETSAFFGLFFFSPGRGGRIIFGASINRTGDGYVSEKFDELMNAPGTE